MQNGFRKYDHAKFAITSRTQKGNGTRHVTVVRTTQTACPVGVCASARPREQASMAAAHKGQTKHADVMWTDTSMASSSCPSRLLDCHNNCAPMPRGIQPKPCLCIPTPLSPAETSPRILRNLVRDAIEVS